MQQSPVSLDLCWRKTRSGKSRDYRDVIVFEKLRFQKCFSSTLKRKAGVFRFFRFEERFRDRLVYKKINLRMNCVHHNVGKYLL